MPSRTTQSLAIPHAHANKFFVEPTGGEIDCQSQRTYRYQLWICSRTKGATTMKSAFLIFTLLFGQLAGLAWEFSVAAAQASADAEAGSGETNGVAPPDPGEPEDNGMMPPPDDPPPQPLPPPK
jgi:hypothetical protein